MSIESIIGIISGVITIGLFVPVVYNYFKKRSLTEMMNSLVNRNYSTVQHQKILRRMNRVLVGAKISESYIQGFVLNNRGKEAVFKEICEKNDIEPTREICVKMLGADMKKFREEYNTRRRTRIGDAVQNKASDLQPAMNKPQAVYMSELLRTRYPETCARLIEILEKHGTEYHFLKGTKDIWCRDYMPVRTGSGKLVQFRYDPSYLKGKPEWEESRSDVDYVCHLNGLNVQKSDINLDGGNVLICDGRAIISDRVFSENPNKEKKALLQELSHLLECEIIIVPSIREDFTGHADGMVRFVDRNTILGNSLKDEYKYWRDGIMKVLSEYDLNYIEVPFITDMKDRKHPNSALGIYVNYLEVNDLIIAPVFNRPEDEEVVSILKIAFPNKIVETIDYKEVALEGGLVNCSTWVN